MAVGTCWTFPIGFFLAAPSPNPPPLSVNRHLLIYLNTAISTASDTMTITPTRHIFTMLHPLNPITTTELAKAVSVLRTHYNGAQLRFKFIDALECPKEEVIAWLAATKSGKLAQTPHRRARIYFHQRLDAVFQKAIVDITAGVVVSVESLPDVQGPVGRPSVTNHFVQAKLTR